MKVYLRSAWAILLGMVLLQGCNESKTVDPTPAPAATGQNDAVVIGGVSVAQKNGVLAFASKQEFERVIKGFEKMKPEQQAQAAAGDKFVSFAENRVVLEKQATTFDELPHRLVETGKLPDLKSPLLLAMLNGQGMIQIGTDVFRVGTQKVYRVDAGKEELLLQPGFEQNKVLEAHAIERVVSSSREAKVAATNNYIDFDDGHRAIGSFWKENYFFYAYTGVEIHFEEKHTKHFLWWSWDSWDNSCTDNIGFTVSYARIYYWIHSDKDWFSYEEQWLEYNNYSESASCSASKTLGWVAFGTVDVPELHVDYTATFRGQTKTRHFDW